MPPDPILHHCPLYQSHHRLAQDAFLCPCSWMGGDRLPRLLRQRRRGVMVPFPVQVQPATEAGRRAWLLRWGEVVVVFVM